MIHLIGAGGHADDIALTLPPHAAHKHHRECPILMIGDELYIGINDPQVRAQVSDELGILDSAWIHPDAYCGAGTYLHHGAHVNYQVGMTRTNIGHHTTISPGVTICGDVTIGDRVMVGAGATIINLISIADDAVIGAGAVVLEDVGPGETWVGNPARRIK